MKSRRNARVQSHVMLYRHIRSSADLILQKLLLLWVHLSAYWESEFLKTTYWWSSCSPSARTNLKSNIPLKSTWIWHMFVFSSYSHKTNLDSPSLLKHFALVLCAPPSLFQEEILRSFLLSIANQPVSPICRIQGVLYNYGNENHPALYAKQSLIAGIIEWSQAITSFLSFMALFCFTPFQQTTRGNMNAQ